MLRMRLLVPFLLFVCLSCSSSEPAATALPGRINPADADISKNEAVEIATTVLASRSFASDYASDPSRVEQFGRAWEVYFPLKEITRFPAEVALCVDMMTGEVEWSYLE